MKCPKCNNKLEYREPVFSNYNSDRVVKGECTGEVYYCNDCEESYLDDFLDNKLRQFYFE